MTPRELNTRRSFILRELIAEARLTRNPYTARRLRAAAHRLLYRASAVLSPDPIVRAELAALIDDAIGELAAAIVTRSEQQLEQGVPASWLTP